MRILVIGDLMLDQVIDGNANRLSPEAPVPVISSPRESSTLGGAANTAINCKKLGANVTLAGSIANDDSGKKLLSLVADNEIDLSLIKLNSSITTKKVRVLATGQQITRIDYEQRLTYEESLLIWKDAYLSDLDDPYDAIIVSDYDKGVCNNSSMNLNKFKESNKRVIVDPKGSDFLKYSGALVLTPNKNEFEVVFGEWKPKKLKEATEYLGQANINNICITLGSDGFMCDGVDGFFSEPTNASDVFDVTGAGDSFISGLGIGIASKKDLKSSLVLANQAAGVAVRKKGTYAVTKEDIKDFL